MNGGNIRLRMTLKINVGCLSLASEMNGGNIWLRMTLKINVGCLSFASEMNGGNIRLRMTQKNRVEEAVICLCWRKGRTPTLQFYFCKNGCGLTAGEYGSLKSGGYKRKSYPTENSNLFFINKALIKTIWLVTARADYTFTVLLQFGGAID